MTDRRGDKTAGLVADADVLIDYVDSDMGVLSLVSRHIAPVYVPSPVFEEVEQLNEKQATQLAISIIEPTLAQAMEAEAGRGVTSFQDQLCLIVARDGGWSVFTNDKKLRSCCKEAKIPCLWGLEAMVILVRQKHLRPPDAARVATRIAEVNNRITKHVLKTFLGKIGL